MFRKLTVLVCLISFAPAAVGAQELAMLAAPSAAVAVTAEHAMLPQPSANLSLPTGRSEAILLAAADTSQNAAAASAPEQAKAKASHSSFNWSNFGEVHLGGYRWIWWVGAVAALVAIHANAD